MRNRFSVVVLLACLGCSPEPADEVARDRSAKQPSSTAKLQDQTAAAEQPNLTARAEDLKQTIVTPHLELEIPADTNVLWCSSFQLAWNELCDLAGGTVEMESPPAMVAVLNKKTTTKADLDEESYVALAGLASEGIYDRIRAELAAKFPSQNDFLDALDSVPEMAWVAVAFMFKEMPFDPEFNRHYKNLDFGGRRVDSFGIATGDDATMADQVLVLDYRNNSDLIIELKTQAENDRLILAMIPPEKTLGETIRAVEERIANVEPGSLQAMEDLLVPVLDFDILREYSELYDRPIHGERENVGGTPIVVGLQSIRFRLDERGSLLKSWTTVAGGLLEESVRRFIFDKPFLILLRRRDAQHPFFALWVGNSELLVPAENPVKPE